MSDSGPGEPQAPAPLLLAAGATVLGIADVVRWIDRQEPAEVQPILETLSVEEARNAFRRDPGPAAGASLAAVGVPW